MTSTSFNVGIGEGRMSSRVLRPPGGGHTDIFGGDPEPPRGRRLAPSAAAAAVSGQEPAKPEPAEAPVQNGQSQEAPAPVLSPEPEVQVQPQSQPEPLITPESPKKESPISIQEPNKMEPPKRVRVPPGGFSSGLW